MPSRARVFWLYGVSTRKHNVNPRFSHFSRRDIGCCVAKLSGSSMRTSPVEIVGFTPFGRTRVRYTVSVRYALIDRDAPHRRVEQISETST